VSAVEIGIDIGGTFTDVVLIRDGSSVTHTKVPSTPVDHVAGVRDGIRRILELAEVAPEEVTRLVHGSTVATNAFLERKGSLTGLLATAGFEDALEIGRTQRTHMYDLILEPVAPGFLARRRHRHGIAERVGADGSIVTPLDEELVRRAARALVADGVQAVAVCYLFSFVEPAHELRTREILQEEAPGIHVSLSCEIDPQFREFERAFVTTLDAYLRSSVRGYVGRMGEMLTDEGIHAPLQIMQSRGGIQNAEAAARRPITMLLSGLAAGVIGSRFAAQRAGIPNVVTLDIGGTSCDVALIQQGKPRIAGRGAVGGYPLRLQLVDVSTIGAGGGSLVWLDEGGGLRVGPQSAGADPGPACYGWGGTQATVTDASVVLGYLNPGDFAGGALTLDLEAAQRAIAAVGEPLGLGDVVAAAGIHRIVNARMADEIRLVSLQRGYDPRGFGILALGGGGPLHGGAIADALGLRQMIVPEAPGVLSAFGLLVSDIELEQVASLADRVRATDEVRLVETLDELRRSGRARLLADGLDVDRVEVVAFGDFRYRGQSYELAVRLPFSDVLAGGTGAFHDLHERVYGHADRSAPVELVAVRTVHRLPVVPPRPSLAAKAASADECLLGVRPAYFEAAEGFVDTPRYDRRRLPVGAVIHGPAVLEQSDTTVVVHPGWVATVHETDAVIVEAAT
jgi:N-methylhydantoinase A